MDGWPLRLALLLCPAWRCPGCALGARVWLLILPHPAQLSRLRQAGAPLRLGHPGQGLGKTLGVPRWGGWEEPTAGSCLCGSHRGSGLPPSCRAGGTTNPHPQATSCCVSPGSLCLPHSLPSLCATRMHRSGSRCGAHERGQGWGSHRLKPVSTTGCWGPGKSRGPLGPQALPLSTGDLKGPALGQDVLGPVPHRGKLTSWALSWAGSSWPHSQTVILSCSVTLVY